MIERACRPAANSSLSESLTRRCRAIMRCGCVLSHQSCSEGSRAMKQSGLTRPWNLPLTTWTEKCVSPDPPPTARIGAWCRCAAESFEISRTEGARAAESCLWRVVVRGGKWSVGGNSGDKDARLARSVSGADLFPDGRLDWPCLRSRGSHRAELKSGGCEASDWERSCRRRACAQREQRAGQHALPCFYFE